MRVVIAETVENELVQSGQLVIVTGLTHREDHGDRLRQQAPCDERQRLRGDSIEPLRVIHEAEQRPLLRHIREQAENREADQKAIRRRARTQPECRAERIALRSGKTLQSIEEWRTQLMQSRERKLLL